MVQLTIEQQLADLAQQYQVVSVIDLDQWPSDYDTGKTWLIDQLTAVRRDVFDINERLVFTLTQDYFVKNESPGLILKNLQVLINEIDISNFFIIVLSSSANINTDLEYLASISSDPVPITGIQCLGKFKVIPLERHPHSQREIYQYGSANPIKIKLSELTERENFLLVDSKVFCMYPWIHLHAYPTGEAFPCCHAEMSSKLGSAKNNTLEEIFHSDAMNQLRKDMLTETKNSACVRCYEQQEHGFFTGRQSANKHFGHYINRVSETQPDGHLQRFEMNYWDIRFSNLCNLSCRSCGHIFSSSWYQDQANLTGPQWQLNNQALNIAGKNKDDMWNQLLPHLDYVEQIYFAGGEPLMMEEHYNILDELERRGRFDVRLIYNTNFTHTKLKDREVFDYWRKFKSVAVGASLDAMGPRAEYIRKGTNWDRVRANRDLMLATCPDVDFYISPTLSILNAHHLPDFHRSWVEQGLIRAQDLNVNILQDPAYLRIDIATPEYKQELIEKYQRHLSWLRPQDPLNRATVGFESAINFLTATDNTALLPKFWAKTQELDGIRNESVLTVIPELSALQ